MLIVGLKEGSAGLLPLSGAAPAIWARWKGKEEDEGERKEQSKHYYSSDHSHARRGNIWGIFNSNIFNKKFSNKGRCHGGALLSPTGSQGQHTLSMHTSPTSTHQLELKGPAFVPITMGQSVLSPPLMGCGHQSGASQTESPRLNSHITNHCQMGAS